MCTVDYRTMPRTITLRIIVTYIQPTIEDEYIDDNTDDDDNDDGDDEDDQGPPPYWKNMVKSVMLF